MSETKIWDDYYEHAGLGHQDVRVGNEPRLMLQDEPAENVIVLVHGLTDSPFFMHAIGEYFHAVMGFDVFVPLLAGHGLKEPRGMKDASLEAWMHNVDYALDQAHERNQNAALSIGGLSTGGALSVHRALENLDRITGGVFLFSAALDLAGKYGDIHGDFREFILRVGPIARIFAAREDKTPLIGQHPYRYARMDIDGATQLAKLIAEIDDKIRDAQLGQPLFVAHSEYDSTADIQGVEMLINRSATSEFFRIGKSFAVPHASIALKEHIFAENGSPLESKNPFFHEMMEAMHRFARQHLQHVR
jgi:esterase/lipase